MITVETVEELRTQLQQLRRAGKRIALVPTMGALHRGHLSLVEVARAQADFVVLTIFVNPLQFNSPEDLNKYPRTLKRDMDQAASVGVDLVFAPSVKEIYPNLSAEGSAEYTACRILAGSASAKFEGPFRPGHFDGVTTVVGLLFNIVDPDVAVFGEKDFQQLRVIEQLVRDLSYRVKIVGAPLVRDEDGLALSSRNERLSSEDRLRALELSRALFWAQETVSRGMRNASQLVAEIRQRLEETGGLKVDYVAVVDPLTFDEVTDIQSAAQVLVAAFVDQVRLIDNIRVTVS